MATLGNPPPWPPMRDPAMHDDRIELFVADLANQLTARSLWRDGDLPHEATYLFIPATARRRVPHLAELYRLDLETMNRYTVSVTGETQQLVVSCPDVPPASIATAVANTFQPTQDFVTNAHAAINHLYTGDYGTDPRPHNPAAEALSVLLRDSGHIPHYDGDSRTSIWPLASLYLHIEEGNLHEVSHALTRKT